MKALFAPGIFARVPQVRLSIQQLRGAGHQDTVAGLNNVFRRGSQLPAKNGMRDIYTNGRLLCFTAQVLQGDRLGAGPFAHIAIVIGYISGNSVSVSCC